MLRETQRLGRPCSRCGGVIRYKSNGWCVACLRESNRGYQQRNRDTLLVKKREWAKANPEKNRAQSTRWQKENSAKASAQQKRSRSLRPDHYRVKYREYGAARRAAELRAMPEWVDRGEIERIYRGCPPGSHVDHIVPLRGRLVCGLHVPWNLQYLAAHENARKGNRHDS